MKHSNRYGKHIITTKDFKIGQTVIVEEAYCIASENALNYLQCANCFERKANLIPCKNCSAILFCSQTCYDIGHESFHAIECRKTAVHSKWKAARRVVTQTVIKAINLFSKVKDLMGIIEKFNNRKLNSVENYSDPSIRAYMQFFGLSRDFGLATETPEFTFLANTEALHSQILSNPTYNSFFRSDESKRFLAHLIMHHFHVITINGFAAVSLLHGTYINELGTDLENLSGFNYAHGIYISEQQPIESFVPTASSLETN